MERKANDLKVYTENGEIVIGWNEEDYPDSRVFVTPDQVVQLIEWLREARDELRGESAEKPNG